MLCKILQKRYLYGEGTFLALHRTGSKGLFRKKFEKSKNFFGNPGRFRKKSDYIGEGAFPPSFTFVDGEEIFLKNFQNALQNFAKKGTI